MTGIEPAKNMSHNHVRLPVSPHSPYNTRRGVSPFSLLTKLLPLVWVTGLEPAISTSQMSHDTYFATPSYKTKSPEQFLAQGFFCFLLCYLFFNALYSLVSHSQKALSILADTAGAIDYVTIDFSFS